jgi:DNA-binding IclR family transcriptional regulator
MFQIPDRRFSMRNDSIGPVTIHHLRTGAQFAMAGAATVEKALDVLFHLHAAEGARGLGEIARSLGLAKSSCHRLLSALVQREVVEQDESGRYRPGLALLTLGLGVQRREPAVELARPHLEAEAARLGETVFLVAARRGRLRVLDKCEGSGFLRAAPGIGDEIPVDVTATGKLYRLHGAGDELRSDGAVPTEDGAAGRLPDRVDFERAEPESAHGLDAPEREAIRTLGHAVNRDAWIEGLSVLAVPIWQRGRDGGDRMVAVMALAAASARFEALGEARIAERLHAAAAAVSERLGAHGGERAPAPRARREERER